jgi:hypothetical protein
MAALEVIDQRVVNFNVGTQEGKQAFELFQKSGSCFNVLSEFNNSISSFKDEIVEKIRSIKNSNSPTKPAVSTESIDVQISDSIVELIKTKFTEIAKKHGL